MPDPTPEVPRAIDYGYRISRLKCMAGEKIPVTRSELPEIAKYLLRLGFKPTAISPEAIEAAIYDGTARFAGHSFKLL
jgi:hypothetical protein